MKIHTIRQPATEQQVHEMLEAFGDYIKLAVDVERGVLAGGGGLHADCEQALLDDGSRGASIWGADWRPETREVLFGSFINIRPSHGNRSMLIESRALRERVEAVVRRLLEVRKP
ncbi:MAG: hypothetical protein FJ291_32240 [Planctomycetes bacterium]|nr:hypothetical protein [Planctomycetota bacterium]